MSKLEIPQVDTEKQRQAALDKVEADLSRRERDARASSHDPHAKARARVGALVCREPSKTVHSQAYETDINNMVKGLVPFTQRAVPGFYIDETILPLNYEAQFNAVLEAQDAFMQLPPDVRAKFDNDPAKLAQALSDPSRAQELRDLGVTPPLRPDSPHAKPNAKEPEATQPKPPAPPVGASEGAV